MPVGDAERAERALIGVVSDLGILPGNLGWVSIRVVRKSLLVRAIEGLDYGMNGSRCRTCKCHHQRHDQRQCNHQDDALHKRHLLVRGGARQPRRLANGDNNEGVETTAHRPSPRSARYLAERTASLATKVIGRDTPKDTPAPVGCVARLDAGRPVLEVHVLSASARWTVALSRAYSGSVSNPARPRSWAWRMKRHTMSCASHHQSWGLSIPVPP